MTTERGIQMRDYRKILLKTGDVLLDGRGDVWRVAETQRSFQREGVATVEPYYKRGALSYRRAYHTFKISPEMADYYRGTKNQPARVRLYNRLVEDIHGKGENRKVLRDRKVRLDEILHERGIRK